MIDAKSFISKTGMNQKDILSENMYTARGSNRLIWFSRQQSNWDNLCKINQDEWRGHKKILKNQTGINHHEKRHQRECTQFEEAINWFGFPDSRAIGMNYAK